MTLLRSLLRLILFIFALFIVFIAVIIGIIIYKPLNINFLMPMIDDYITIPEYIKYDNLQVSWDTKKRGPELGLSNLKIDANNKTYPIGDIIFETNLNDIIFKQNISLDSVRLSATELNLYKKNNEYYLNGLLLHKPKERNVIKPHNSFVSDDEYAQSQKLLQGLLQELQKVSKYTKYLYIDNLKIQTTDADMLLPSGEERVQSAFLDAIFNFSEHEINIKTILYDSILLEAGESLAAEGKLNLQSGELKFEAYGDNTKPLNFIDIGFIADINNYWPYNIDTKAEVFLDMEGSLINWQDLTINIGAKAQDAKFYFLNNPEQVNSLSDFAIEASLSLKNATFYINHFFMLLEDANSRFYLPKINDASLNLSYIEGRMSYRIKKKVFNIDDIFIKNNDKSFRLSLKYDHYYKNNAVAITFAPMQDLSKVDLIEVLPNLKITNSLKDILNKYIISGSIDSTSNIGLRINMYEDNSRKFYFDGYVPFYDVVVKLDDNTLPIEYASGYISLNDNTLDINTISGYMADIKLPNFKLEVSNLSSKDSQKFKFSSNYKTKVKPLLRLLSYQPALKDYAYAFNYLLPNSSADVNLNINYEQNLGEKANLDNLKIDGDLSSVLIKAKEENSNIAAENIAINYHNQQLNVSGSIDIANGMKLNVDNFNLQKNENLNWQLSADLQLLENYIKNYLQQHLSKNYNASIAFSGDINTKLSISGTGSNFSGNANANLKNATYVIPFLNIAKDKGREANLKFNLSQDESGLNIKDAIYDANNGSFNANINLNNGKLASLKMTEINFGRTNANLEYLDNISERKLLLSGALDISQIGKLSSYSDSSDKKNSSSPLNIDIKLNKLYMGKSKNFNNVIGNIYINEAKAQSANIIANTISGSNANLKLSTERGFRVLTLNSANAGEFLNVMGMSENIQGGSLTFDGIIDDSKETMPITGKAVLNDFSMTKSPAILKLFASLSLNEMLSHLSGGGLNIKNSIIPFTLENSQIKIDNATFAGTNIGGSASGTYNIDNKYLDFSGKIVPLYSVSQTISSIPVISQILTGVENDGIFAADYRIYGSNDNFTVVANPLKTIAPGIVRDILGEVLGGNNP